MASLIFFSQLVLVLGVARLAEFALARANTDWALSRGGKEHGQEEYRPFAGAWLLLYIGTLFESWVLQTPFIPLLGAIALAAVLLAEGVRWWAIVSLGRRWTNRIIIIPGDAPATAGPYRYLRHPGHLTCLVLGLALPLAHSAWITAILVTALNIAVINARITLEERLVADGTSTRVLV